MNQAKNKKALELLYRVSLTPKFQKDVAIFRKKFGIPTGGFSTKVQAERWMKEKRRVLDSMAFWRERIPVSASKGKFFISRGDYVDAEYRIMSKYKLPVSSRKALEELLFSRKELSVQLPEIICDIEIPSENEILQRGQKFLRFIIYDHVSEGDVKNYLSKEWHKIKKLLNTKGQERIRTSTNKNRDAIIFSLWNKTRQELGMKDREAYKDIFIARMLKEQGYQISPENVRKIASRQKKMRGQ